MKKKFLAAVCAICVCIASVLFYTPASADQQGRYVTYGDLVSAKPGNIFYGTEPIVFTIEVINNTDGIVYGRYSYTITDEAGKTVYSYGPSSLTSLNARRKGNHTITLPPNGKYGLYTLNLTAESNNTKSLVGMDSKQFSVDFSICIPLNENNVDQSFGFNQSVVNNGNYPAAVPLMKNAGAKWHRESVMWQGVEPKEKGKYIPLGTYAARLLDMKNSGIDTVCVLHGRNNLYDHGFCPNTTEGIAAYAAFCAHVARGLKGAVKYYEIYNEWNSSNFNPSMETPETYAKVLKAAYTAIKEVDPDIVVIGCDTADIPLDWMKRVFDAGGGDYMDAISVHCYDYTAEGGFPEQDFKTKVENFKAFLAERGIDKPIWLSEIGFSTYENSTVTFVPGCSEDEQLNSIVMLGAVNKAYGLFNNILLYGLNDRGIDKSKIELNWGVLRDWANGDLKNGAKEAYLGIAAMNYFIGGGAEFKDKTEDLQNRQYAFGFYNRNLQKNVTLLISGGSDNTAEKMLNIGCKNIDVYDKYGNRIKQLTSSDGRYKVRISSEPTYLVYGPELTVKKNNTTVTDMSGLNSGDKLEISLSGMDAAASSPKVIAAQYNGESFIKADPFTVDSEVFSGNITVADGADRIKIVYWNMDQLTPLCDCYEIK